MFDAARPLRLPLRLGLAFLALALIAGCGKKEGAKAPPTGPAMWHLSDQDSDIYLYGTFHLLPPDMDWQRPAMTAAFDDAAILILEADVNGAAAGEMVNLIREYAIAPSDKPLSSRLTPEQAEQFNEICKSLQLDPVALDRFQPWYAATVLTVKYAQARGLSAGEGVEQKLIAKAKAEHKPMAYLETVAEQINFFASLPEHTQVEMLTATLEELKTSDKLLADMQDAWLTGDTKAMAGLFDQSIREVPELYQRLLVDRNRRWAEEIEKLMAGEGKAFIAVGAGHLVGKDSVVALLRAKGFEVEGP